jgi:hypothetical protein
MILQLILTKPVAGYWDGGGKTTFNWSIDGAPETDDKGQYVKIGSWEANNFFHVAMGATEKKTLANARRHLTAMLKKRGLTGTFSYTN